MNRIVLMTEDPGWHGEELRVAFEKRSSLVSYVSLKDCRLSFGHGAIQVSIPGFEHGLPDGVFVRGVPGGTLEQIVQRLNILYALHELGVPVHNDSKAIERTVDKAMTSFLLSQARIPTPTTWVCESLSQARAIVMRETAAGRDIVMKPLFGSQGIGLVRLSAGMPFPDLAQFNEVAYLQEFIPSSVDYRVLVMNGKAIAQMRRRGANWINNVAQGGRPQRVALDDELKELSEASARAIAIDYCGVDILRDQNGRTLVLEVNGIPAWRGLQSVTDFNLAEALVSDFLARKVQRPPLEVVC
jgi:tetrahydromethanopterin:alpha-L-glutamate ligase